MITFFILQIYIQWNWKPIGVSNKWQSRSYNPRTAPNGWTIHNGETDLVSWQIYSGSHPTSEFGSNLYLYNVKKRKISAFFTGLGCWNRQPLTDEARGFLRSADPVFFRSAGASPYPVRTDPRGAGTKMRDQQILHLPHRKRRLRHQTFHSHQNRDYRTRRSPETRPPQINHPCNRKAIPLPSTWKNSRPTDNKPSSNSARSSKRIYQKDLKRKWTTAWSDTWYRTRCIRPAIIANPPIRSRSWTSLHKRISSPFITWGYTLIPYWWNGLWLNIPNTAPKNSIWAKAASDSKNRIRSPLN